ncbi:MAG: DUF3421 domain-containing protein [Gammaproteobacteria bacterium]|nr:DUF3421 domain-containing protein [Gammaproteobacteria bacterium]
MKKTIITLALLSGLPALSLADSSASYGVAPAPVQSTSSVSYGDSSASSSSASYGQHAPLPTVTVTTNQPADHYRPDGINWVRGNYGMLPQDAVAGGRQPNQPHTLYVCHADYQGGVHPGKLIAGKCNISWGGREIEMPDYEVLVSRVPLIWMQTRYGNIPANAVAGGYEGQRTLYICQANYMGGVHPGKVVGNHCNFGWGGKEISLPNFRVLVR